MKRVAIIGTGIMGSGMATNFLKAGYGVTVWNRTPEHAKALIEQGASLATSPRTATETSDIIFEVTANDESSQAVWHGDDGILAGANTDKTLVTSATLTVSWTEKLAAECAEKSFTFFDMPLTGGRVAAEAGSLTLLVGGDETKLELLKPDLKAISSKIFYFGPAGSGMKYKLILNSLQASHLEAFAEAMRLAAQAGLEASTVGSALVDRPGGVITELAWRSFQEQKPPLTFSVDWITKDLDYAQQLANGIELPIFKKVLDTYRQAQNQGHGQDDWTMIIK